MVSQPFKYNTIKATVMYKLFICVPCNVLYNYVSAIYMHFILKVLHINVLLYSIVDIISIRF